jgi:hypothetical protein
MSVQSQSQFIVSFLSNTERFAWTTKEIDGDMVSVLDRTNLNLQDFVPELKELMLAGFKDGSIQIKDKFKEQGDKEMLRCADNSIRSALQKSAKLNGSAYKPSTKRGPNDKILTSLKAGLAVLEAQEPSDAINATIENAKQRIEAREQELASKAAKKQGLSAEQIAILESQGLDADLIAQLAKAS